LEERQTLWVISQIPTQSESDTFPSSLQPYHQASWRIYTRRWETYNVTRFYGAASFDLMAATARVSCSQLISHSIKTLSKQSVNFGWSTDYIAQLWCRWFGCRWNTFLGVFLAYCSYC